MLGASAHAVPSAARTARCHLGNDAHPLPVLRVPVRHGGDATNAPETALEVKADDEFPVNRGQMCIKGFTSAALIDHPARLTAPLLRGRDGQLAPGELGRRAGLRRRAHARRCATAHGAAALAAFGSGALTNEKAYLLGKFVRVALRSPNIDYNGRYCMASAAAGQNRAFGIDRGLPFPVSDIAETKTLHAVGLATAPRPCRRSCSGSPSRSSAAAS